MADTERTTKRDLTTDGAYNRVHESGTHADLQGTRHVAVDRKSVTVTPAGHKWAHDRISRLEDPRWLPLSPFQPAGPDELKFKHLTSSLSMICGIA
jgi:hypothetical protein